MKPDRYQDRSIDEINGRLSQHGPPEPRVVYADAQVQWNADVLYSLSRNKLAVLGRSTDIIVFFDAAGDVLGWRDDGRKGAEWAAPVSDDAFASAVTAELGLPADARLGRLRPIQLPPIGWTHEGVIFLKPIPTGQDTLRVWVNPQNLRIIQCLYDQSPVGGGVLL